MARGVEQGARSRKSGQVPSQLALTPCSKPPAPCLFYVRRRVGRSGKPVNLKQHLC
jgi:hypothetical protein